MRPRCMIGPRTEGVWSLGRRGGVCKLSRYFPGLEAIPGDEFHGSLIARMDRGARVMSLRSVALWGFELEY